MTHVPFGFETVIFTPVLLPGGGLTVPVTSTVAPLKYEDAFVFRLIVYVVAEAAWLATRSKTSSGQINRCL